MPKVTTIKISDELDKKLTEIRAEINKLATPLNVKRQEIIFLALENFVNKEIYKEIYGIKKNKFQKISLTNKETVEGI